MVREIVIILAITTVLSAETIGDFAPLQVGNVWVYDVKKTYVDGTYQSGYREEQTGTCTITLTHQGASGDTLEYYLETHLLYSAKVDSFFEDSGWKTTREYDSTYTGPDTLFAWDDTIRNRGRAEIIPIWFTHRISTGDTTVDSLRYADGEKQFTAEKNATVPPVYPLYCMDFSAVDLQAGTGVTRYFYAGGIAMYSYDITFTLASFTMQPVSIAPAPLSREVSVVRNRQAAAHEIALPRINVTRNGETFSLLGRIHRKNPAIKAYRRQQWHEQVFDLFR